MRLLERKINGEISLTEDFLEEKVPRYAILSHTWGTEEVSFKAMMDGTAKNKLGYDKIRFCRDQAWRDGLHFFWVDTCCIDKSNNTEVQEAINSMFRWYRNSIKCYVYLADISTHPFDATDKSSQPSWESAFRKSRWFTRGWTLQELIAPASVEFFSKGGVRLGSKSSLEKHIHNITGIPLPALRGSPLSDFSIPERMAWIEKRDTTRKEDKAYSLLGIFDVQMPLIYGEGEKNAFRRLREEINKASASEQTLNQSEERCLVDLRSTDPRHDKIRIEDTKGGLLRDSYRWVLGNAEFQRWRNDEHSGLLWIKGDPGKGKTMLLCGIIDELSPATKLAGEVGGTLLSYFFCQATDSRINSATAVLRGLVYLLANQQHSLLSYVRKKYDRAGKQLFEDANAWVALSEILTNILQDPSLKSTHLIIDALDECVTDLPLLFDFIVGKSSISSRVKWIVSSRNWPNIEEHLEAATQRGRLCLELNEKSVSTAVDIYIRYKVDQLALQKRYDESTRNAIQNHLCSDANGTFLWVALVCQSLRNTSRLNTMASLAAFPRGLDSFYKRMVQNMDTSDNADLCRRVLAVVATVYRPLSLDELKSFVELPGGTPDDLDTWGEVIGFCGSLLTLRGDAVYFVHQSAKDFLLSQASDVILPSGIQSEHCNLFSRSLLAMSRTLRHDIYGLRAPGLPIHKVKQRSPDPLAAIRYSCVYWVDHLYAAGSLKTDSQVSALTGREGTAVHEFLRKNFLYWLEALSLGGGITNVGLAISKLEQLAVG
ncbi:NACHT domain-containing protein [Cladophialophora immunda]|nr:NACHT domain-containing protein [Cladophialophora immunda]